MTTTDAHGRIEPPEVGDEVSTLLGFLDFQRATFAWKIAGLDAGGFAATLASSSMTLGGMTKHLALVEDYWFSQWLWARGEGTPWSEIDWGDDPDWEWHSAASESPEQLVAIWREAADRARAATNEALRGGGMEQRARRIGEDGRAPSLRWIVCHMIEEYARHNGHADLLREAIDGETGE